MTDFLIITIALLMDVFLIFIGVLFITATFGVLYSLAFVVFYTIMQILAGFVVQDIED